MQLLAPRNSCDPFVHAPNDPPVCPAWGVGHKALKAQPSSATRGRAQDRSASNGVASRFNVRSARNSFRRLSFAPNDPPACPAWGWGPIGACSSRFEPPSVLHLRADCGGRLFTAKLGVVVIICRINCSITCWRMTPSCWLVSSATVFAIASMTSSASPVSTLSEPACPIPCGPKCIGLRVRSLNDPHDARLRPFNRHTLEPAAASRCEPTHPSPCAC